VESGACDFCRDDQDLLHGLVEQVASDGSDGLLIVCPDCRSLYLATDDGATKPRLVDAAEASRWMNWSRDAVLAAVRTALSRRRSDSSWTFEGAELEEDGVLVIFRVGSQGRFGMYYDLSEVPVGDNTGMLCATPEDWAIEIVLTLDEQTDTGGIAQPNAPPGQTA